LHAFLCWYSSLAGPNACKSTTMSLNQQNHPVVRPNMCTTMQCLTHYVIIELEILIVEPQTGSPGSPKEHLTVKFKQMDCMVVLIFSDSTINT
jgi:hypothetical protein